MDPAPPAADGTTDAGGRRPRVTCRWHAVKAVFAEAVALDPDERPAFLDRACRTSGGAEDVGLRREVERLLGVDIAAETFADGLRAALDRPPPEAGPWRLVERVGEGGMGEVWRARRGDGAYDAEAAVKLVRPGLAPDLAARFRAEGHVLARLDHPAVARLLDGGTTSDGRPYLALEYVRGEPITAYSDRRRLPVDARLGLFEEVCAAVAAAHRQLVVHRDLKPSNVLVCEVGPPDGGGRGRPQVKLLDFGIAKLLDDGASLGVTAPLTRPDRRLMTPAYAAPEQVRGEPATTATDVYSLGVLLYELLAGCRPHGAAGRSQRAVEEAVLREDPAEPSAAATEAAAAARATDPARLRRRLRGDLDRIVLQALRKEPGRRYGSAEDMRRDVRRHLDGLPVAARPDRLAYRAGKFVRRHRAAVAATASVAAALLTAAAVEAVQAAIPTAAFADRVVRADNRGQYVRPDNRDPAAALGPPDSGPGAVGNDVSLGWRGELVLAFDDNVLVDGPGDDLVVYEVLRVGERAEVSVSEDGQTFLPVGVLSDLQDAFDVGPVARPGARFRYVRLVDVWTQQAGMNIAPGVDIDAVGVIHGDFAGWKRPLAWLGLRPHGGRPPDNVGRLDRAVDRAFRALRYAERGERLGQWALARGHAERAVRLAADLQAGDPAQARAVAVRGRCLAAWVGLRLGEPDAAPAVRRCARAAPAVFASESDEAVRARLYQLLLDDPAVWADRVVAHRPGTAPLLGVGAAWRPALALGPPDHLAYGPPAAFPLAPGGTLVVAFDDNALVDRPGPDLAVLTVGLRTDRMDVAVSEDGRRWTSLGSDWGLGVFDLAGRAEPGARFRRVRVTYAPRAPERLRRGLDVDAVAALASAPAGP